MDLETLWHKALCAWQRLAPDGKTFLRKCIPAVLVVVFASATVLAVLGVQENGEALITLNGSKAALEAEKEKLEAEQKSLSETLAQTQKLLGELTATKNDTQVLLQEAQQEEDAVAAKLDELKATMENFKNYEMQRWVMPIQYKRCSSPYGYRDHPIAGESKFHYGVDLAADRGTPIVASRSGTVTLAAFQEDNAGNWVIIDHMDGYDSRYMHMDKYIVTEGQFVMAGQIIGYCGATGAATGNHLHFGIYYNNEAVNPGDYIDLY